MKTLISMIVIAAALAVSGCAIEQTHLLGDEWKKSALDTNGTESRGGNGGGKK